MWATELQALGTLWYQIAPGGPLLLSPPSCAVQGGLARDQAEGRARGKPQVAGSTSASHRHLCCCRRCSGSVLFCMLWGDPRSGLLLGFLVFCGEK